MAGPGVLAVGRIGPALAAGTPDVSILRTASAVDRAAVGAYDAFLAVEAVTAPPLHRPVVDLLEAARRHHNDHVAAYDDALAKRGVGPPATPNRAVAALVPSDRSRLASLEAVLAAAAAVEEVAADTFQQAVGLLDDVGARSLAAAVAGVEAQHLAVLRLYRALLGSGGMAVLAGPEGSPVKLPPTTIEAALPGPFAEPARARPPGEGSGS